jgi:hypothetical protein
MPEVGSHHSPTALSTLMHLGAEAMSSIGFQTSSGRPLPANTKASSSKCIES